MPTQIAWIAADAVAPQLLSAHGKLRRVQLFVNRPIIFIPLHRMIQVFVLNTRKNLLYTGGS